MADNVVGEKKEVTVDETEQAVLSIQDQVGRMYVPFKPEDHGLSMDFRLTKYGCNQQAAAKPNHHDLQSLLMTFVNSQEVFNQPMTVLTEEIAATTINNNLTLLETSNFLAPIINEPYYLGQIAFSCLMSGFFAVGLTGSSTHRMILSVTNRMNQKDRNIVIPMITQGYLEAAKQHNIAIQAIRVIESSAFSIGGVATALIAPQQMQRTNLAQPGDVLIVTKPLGTTIALALSQAMEVNEKRLKVLEKMALKDIEMAKYRAMDIMVRSNVHASLLMKQYSTHAACEIASDGLVGHAEVLIRKQLIPVRFSISNLPIIAKMHRAAKLLGYSLPLLHGTQPEISGGLLIVMPKDHAKKFLQNFHDIVGQQAWIVGIVEAGNREVRVLENPRVIEVGV